MQLVPNWRRVLRYAWSIRLILLAAVLSGLEIALPLLDGVIDIPRGWLAAACFAATMAALIARFIAQKSVSGE